MPFSTDSVELIEGVPYQETSCIIWRPQNGRISNSHCEILMTLCCWLRKKRYDRAWSIYYWSLKTLWNGNECGKNWSNENLKAIIPITDCDRSETASEVDNFNCFGSPMTNGARCTRETKSRIAVSKTAFSKKTLFTNKLDLKLRKKLVKCYIWSAAFYSAETWHFGKQTRNTFNVFKRGIGESWRGSFAPIMWRIKSFEM